MNNDRLHAMIELILRMIPKGVLNVIILALILTQLFFATSAIMNDLKGFGMNLEDITYYARGTPFKNRFLSAQEFFSGNDSIWSDGRSLNLDENGYPTDLFHDQYARSLFLEVGDYDDGSYSYMNIEPHIFTFEGNCSCCNFRFNAEILDQTVDGQWVINITGSSSRPLLQIECMHNVYFV